jgi:hypothetical protein
MICSSQYVMLILSVRLSVYFSELFTFCEMLAIFTNCCCTITSMYMLIFCDVQALAVTRQLLDLEINLSWWRFGSVVV